MSMPIALQLYTVRGLLAADFNGVVRKVAEMGYAGIETAGFPGTSPQAAAVLFTSLGLKVVAVHAPLPTGEHKDEVLGTCAALECKQLIHAGTDRNVLKTVDQVKRYSEMLNEINHQVQQEGILFGVHNHWWEFQKAEDQWVYRILLENTDPSIFFELDTYWIQVAGFDPVAVIQEFGSRAHLLHIKDGPGFKEQPNVAVGEGVMNIPAVIKASAYPEWLIVEMDSCATDPMVAVKKSFDYLVKAQGKNG
jgi:sugar phosphate isomerase/epimerase